MIISLKICPICGNKINVNYADVGNVRYMCSDRNKYNDSHYIVTSSYTVRIIAGEYLVLKDFNSEYFLIYNYENIKHLDNTYLVTYLAGSKHRLLKLKSLNLDNVQTWADKIKLLLPFS